MWKQSLILRVLFVMLILILFIPISYLQGQASECVEDPYEPPGEEPETLGSGPMINFTGTPPTWTSGPGPEICPAGDDDWFRFSADEGDRIEVICDVITLPVADVHLYKSETLVARKTSRYPGDAEDVMLTYTCPATSPYYSICIYHAEDFTGSYILTVSKMPLPPNDMECGPDPYEDNNTRSQATEIRRLFLWRSWKSKEGTEICPINDQDWFKVKASAGETLNIFCDVTSSKLDAVIGLFKERMWRPLAVQNCQGIGGDEKLTYKCKSSGTYYVGIGSESVVVPRMIMKPGGTGSYRLTIEKSGWR
jgi:hypothetical protein